MKEYSHGVSLDRGRHRRDRTIKRHAAVIATVAIIVSIIVIGAAIISIFSPEEQQEKQKARISWTTEVVDSYGDVGQYSSLAIDPGGSNPMIAYYNETSSDLMVASWMGSSWDASNAYAVGDVGRYSSTARNATMAFIIAYDATNGDLLYGTSVGGYQGIVDSSGDVGQYSSIAVNPVTNTLAISYYNASSGDLKVAVNASGSGWVNKTVDSVGDVGLYTNIVFMGTNDTMSVLYYDATNHALKNAWQWGGAGPWGNMTIDSLGPTGDVGKWPSQFVIGDDWWGSYYDQTNGDLKYQYYVDGSYGIAVPDSVGNVGEYTSIGVNSTGHVFISYYDVTNGDLKLAWNESTTWYNMTLDSTDNVGLYTSLKIDSNDAIHISYYDATNGDLKYVKVLSSEVVPIPEFGDVVIPIVGTIAIMAVLSVRRNRKEK